jgi:hypothetical protein
MSPTKIKQYIVLRHEISPALACIGVGHGVLAAYLKWKDEQIVKDWVSGEYGPFYKVVCQAENEAQWNAIKNWKEDKVVITESSVDNLEIALIFKPAPFSKGSLFNELKLYDGNYQPK